VYAREGYAARLREQWRQTRELVAIAINTQMGIKPHQQVTGAKIIPLEGDKEYKEIRTPKKRLEEMKADMLRFGLVWNNKIAEA